MDKGKSQSDKPGWVDGRICPYIIAEAGVNHNGSVELALKLVDAAKAAGADAVKFQAFTADELAMPDAPKAKYQQACGGKGESQYEMLRRCQLKAEEFAAIMDYSRKAKIDFLVTPFSPGWVKVFVDLGISAFKVGSGNLTDDNLITTIGKTRLPVIVSTGMSDLEIIDRTLEILKQSGGRDIAVLHCVSLYPTRIEQVNLKAIKTLREHTGLPAGFSDHTEEIETGAWAVEAGAVILEKHLTLDKTLDGPDHKMSLNPEEMKEYITYTREAKKNKSQNKRRRVTSKTTLLPWLGDGIKRPLQEEQEIKNIVGLSVLSSIGISAGEIITRDMLAIKRPGTGFPAEKLDEVIGTKALRDILQNQMIQPGIDFSILSHKKKNREKKKK